MAMDVLAKSRPHQRNNTVLGVLDETFEGAWRTIHYPLTAECEFRSVRSLHSALEATLRKFGSDGIDKLSIHGHALKYPNHAEFEFGSDTVTHMNFHAFSQDFAKIGSLMSAGGHIHMLHCFVGGDQNFGKLISKTTGVPVTGEISLNNLSPALTPFQNGFGVGDGLVRVGTRTFYPSGKVETDMRSEILRF